MCLHVDLQATERVRQRLLEAGGSLTVYKLLKLNMTGTALASPFAAFLWESGWNEAEGELPSPLTDGMIVNEGGFHVLLDDPCPDMPPMDMEMVAVPFHAFEQDFVCAGGSHAIFGRLHLAIADHELAIKELGAARPRRSAEQPADQPLHEYQQWVRENQDAAWLRRALVEVAPKGSTEPDRVWIQHRERHRPLRVVPLHSLMRAPDPPAAA